MTSFPFSSDSTNEAYVLWPYTFQEPAGPLSGYLQLPASLFDPMFKPYWELTNQTRPALQAFQQATAPASAVYQNVDNLFPGIDRIANVNPLLAFAPAYEQALDVADAWTAPNAALAAAAKQAVAPIADAIQKGSYDVAAALAPAAQAGVGAIPNVNSLVGPGAPLTSILTGPFNSIAGAVASSLGPSAATAAPPAEEQ